MSENMSEIMVDGKKLGKENRAFIIAEIGINHNGSVDIAKEMIKTAKNVGADAVKFQFTKADKFCSPDSDYHQLFKEIELHKDELKELQGFARSNDIIMFSACSQVEGLDFIENANFPLLKIGSPNITNVPLIKRMSKIPKPIILSTGMSTIEEVREAVDIIRRTNPYPPILLHCISSYPAKFQEVNMKAMQTLDKEFPDSLVGFSDHTTDSRAAIMAVTLGAKVIEKHFTLDKNMEGHDHWFSSDPDEFKKLVNDIRSTEEALGSGTKSPTDSEKDMIKYGRRYLVASSSISSGETLRKDSLSVKRISSDEDTDVVKLIEPRFLDKIAGKRLKKDIEANSPITWDILH